MSNSQRSFDQVKNILGKLDRNIDAARQRRLQGPTPVPGTPATVGTIGAAVVAPPPAPIRANFGSPTPALTPLPTFGNAAPSRSQYGRATPMRPQQQTGT